jgi:uncharacterized repeat protein (TIGR03806 family)
MGPKSLVQQRSAVFGAAGALLALLGLALLSSCGSGPQVIHHQADAYPERLSAWGLIQLSRNHVVLGEDVLPYDVASPLFSDYALKLRTIYLPGDSTMTYHDRRAFAFPVGSIITKTFFYPLLDDTAQAASAWRGDIGALNTVDYRLVETRLLIRQPDGWDALPYVWDGNDAYLRITGRVLPMEVAMADDRGNVAFPYVVPARSECAACHATDHADGDLQLIGIKARHLNHAYADSARTQLQEWADAGRLDGLPGHGVPMSVQWQDQDVSIEARARAYLDSNCGHCHSSGGPAATSGLLLDSHTTAYRPLGFCKPPVAAGRGTGGRAYSIVPGRPDESILVYRMETRDPATRMPEIGRTLVHREAVDLLREWIRAFPGECIQEPRA